MVIEVLAQSGANIVNALRTMREGLLLIFVSWILLGAGVMSIFMGLFAAVTAGGPLRMISGMNALIQTHLTLGGFILGGILLLVGAVLALVGFYSKFIPGAGDLARANPELTTPSTLIKIGYLWGLALIIVGVVLTLILIGVLIILAGVILTVLGYVGVIMMCFKLNDAYPNTLYLVAGILFIIAIPVPVLGAISWILLYVALGETINKIQATVPQPQPF